MISGTPCTHDAFLLCIKKQKTPASLYSLQGLLSGLPVAIATRLPGIRRHGSPDTVHSAPVEELHPPQETKGTRPTQVSGREKRVGKCVCVCVWGGGGDVVKGNEEGGGE